MRLVLLIVLFFTSVTCVHTFLVQATNVKIEYGFEPCRKVDFSLWHIHLCVESHTI